jgi:hypothetical protein
MKAIVISTVIGCCLLTGCGDSNSSSGTSSGNPANAPAEYVGALAQAKQKAVKTVDLSSVTKAIQMFQVEEGRLPKDLNELVEKKYLPKIPDAPMGMKLSYDASTGTVKVVPQ